MMHGGLRSVYGVAPGSGEQYYVASILRGWTGSDRPPGLIFCHGAGHNVALTLTTSQRLLLIDLSQYFTVIATDLGGDQWGSNLHVSRIEDARQYLINTMGCDPKVALVGVSMGNTGTMAFAYRHHSLVRAVVGIIPVCDLLDMKVNRGYGPSIDAAYGGVYNDAVLGDNHNPVRYASTIPASVPISLFYSPTDEVVVPSTVMEIKAQRPATTLVSIGSHGHSDESVLDAMAAGVVTRVRSMASY